MVDYGSNLEGLMPGVQTPVSCEHRHCHGVAWPNTQHLAIFAQAIRIPPDLQEDQPTVCRESIPSILPMP